MQSSLIFVICFYFEFKIKTYDENYLENFIMVTDSKKIYSNEIIRCLVIIKRKMSENFLREREVLRKVCLSS